GGCSDRSPPLALPPASSGHGSRLNPLEGPPSRARFVGVYKLTGLCPEHGRCDGKDCHCLEMTLRGGAQHGTALSTSRTDSKPTGKIGPGRDVLPDLSGQRAGSLFRRFSKNGQLLRIEVPARDPLELLERVPGALIPLVSGQDRRDSLRKIR